MRILSPALFVILILFGACGSNTAVNNELEQRKAILVENAWRFDAVAMKAKAAEMNLETRYVSIMESTLDRLGAGVFTFKADSTMELQYPAGIIPGNWYFSEDGTQFTMTLSGGVIVPLPVEEFSPDRIVLGVNPEKGANFARVLVRATNESSPETTEEPVLLDTTGTGQ